MSYDLIPRNKKVKPIHVGGLTWPIFLQETGMGYVVGYGAGRSPASYVYRPDSKGASPVSNDGYTITALQAKMMATVARGFVSVKNFINKEWDAMPEGERKRSLEVKFDGKPLYQQPWHELRLKEIESFAEFAENSQGFKIS